MPRTVIPLGFKESRMPQIFSLGECRLTTTMEFGSMGSCSRDPSFSLPQETSVLLEFSAAVSGNLTSRFRARPFQLKKFTKIQK